MVAQLNKDHSATVHQQERLSSQIRTAIASMANIVQDLPFDNEEILEGMTGNALAFSLTLKFLYNYFSLGVNLETVSDMMQHLRDTPFEVPQHLETAARSMESHRHLSVKQDTVIATHSSTQQQQKQQQQETKISQSHSPAQNRHRIKAKAKQNSNHKVGVKKAVDCAVDTLQVIAQLEKTTAIKAKK